MFDSTVNFPWYVYTYANAITWACLNVVEIVHIAKTVRGEGLDRKVTPGYHVRD